MDFVDKNVEHVELMKPPPIESTPFKLVEEVKDLKELAAKLRGVNEFAVSFVIARLDRKTYLMGSVSVYFL